MVPDVIVVGGGPTGLAAAIAARQRGLEVLVVDRARPPIDKPCGEGVMPNGVSALRILGVPIDDSGAPSFYGIRFTEAGETVEACFPAVAGYGIGIRRPHLHRLLAARAEEVGVVTRWGEPVTAIRPRSVEISGRSVQCRWIVGADGRESRVRRWAGLGSPSNASRRIGLRQHFRARPWTDCVEVHWHDRGQAVVTPISSNEVCISLFASEPGPLRKLIQFFPDLCHRLNVADPTGSVRGAIAGSSRLRSVVRDEVALIGDASGSVDALTGEGLALGFRQALALAEALTKNDLSRYQATHRLLGRTSQQMARLMLFVGARAPWRRRVLQALATQPQMFGLMLGVHVGALSPSAISPRVVARFIRHLVCTGSAQRAEFV